MSSDLHHQILVTDLPALSVNAPASALRRFCHRPRAYRQGFLQSRYATAFDGYSYPGQRDSLNQGPEDELHSFVVSDFSPPAMYPAELQPILDRHWQQLTRSAHAIEQRILQDLGLTGIAQQHASCFGHMLSANYYPAPHAGSYAVDALAPAPETRLRLSPHPDVSLLTVLFGGIGNDFQYQDGNGHWVDAPPTDRIAVLAGDLLQWLTDGAIPALQHRVKQGVNSGERFSFALFSLPRPGAKLRSDAGRSITTEDWYRLHLSQWDS
jgi:isopenicillin N synthase-like dioxygenase